MKRHNYSLISLLLLQSTLTFILFLIPEPNTTLGFSPILIISSPFESWHAGETFGDNDSAGSRGPLF